MLLFLGDDRIRDLPVVLETFCIKIEFLKNWSKQETFPSLANKRPDHVSMIRACSSRQVPYSDESRESF